MGISKRMAQLQLSPLQSFFRKAKATPDVISFAVGEPDFPTPLEISRAGHNAIESGYTRYTPAGGCLELRKLAAEDFRKSGIRAVEYSNTIVSAGSQILIAVSILAFCDPGDELLVPAPYYPPYVALCRIFGVKPVLVDTSQDEFLLLKKRVEKHLSEKTRAIVINSPNNPTGVVWDTQDLARLGELPISFIVDEAYHRIVYNEDYVSLASLAEMAERTLTIRSCSKSFAMTGWRIGYITGSQEVIEKIEIALEAIIVSPCSISQRAAMAAFSGLPMGGMMSKLKERRNCILEWLSQKRGINYPVPRGAFYIFPNLPEAANMGSMEFAELLLEKGRIGVTPGIAFGKEYDNRVRMSYASAPSLEKLQEGLGRIDNVLRMIRRNWLC